MKKKGKKGDGKGLPPQFGKKDDDDDDDEGEKSTKSVVTVDDFQKSLDQLEAIAKADDGESRKEELLKKAQSGEDLSEEERTDLFKALGGATDDDDEDEDSIVKSVTDPMNPEIVEPLQKALDVSEYLDAQHGALVKSLGEVASALDASDQRQHGFNLVLAKAVAQSGQLLKSVCERMGVLEAQPVRGPKSKGIPAGGATLEKGFGGDEPPAFDLSKSEILDTLESMLIKSVDAGDDGVAKCGEDINGACAKYENSNEISKAMVTEVVGFRKEAETAH